MLVYLNDCKYTEKKLILMYINGRYETDIKYETWQRYLTHTVFIIKQTLNNDKKYKSYEQLLEDSKPKNEIDVRTSQEIYEDTMNLFKQE